MPTRTAGTPPMAQVATRYVADAIYLSGYPARLIAKSSLKTVEIFKSINPLLKGHHFSASLVCRWIKGEVQNFRYEKMIVLKLTLLRLEDASHPTWSQEKCVASMAEAVNFANQVRSLARVNRGRSRRSEVQLLSARHARTVELLGAYGEELLREVGQTSSLAAEAKLAVLHRLGGNVDDARYWSDLASEGLDYTPAISAADLCERARRYASEYLGTYELKIARVYLKLAADYGDEASSRKLHEIDKLINQPALPWGTST